MKRLSKQWRLTSVSALVAPLFGAGIMGCTAQTDDAGEGNPSIASAQQALGPSEDVAVAKTLVPIRSLAAPGNVYMKQVEETLDATGTFSQSVYVYQPDSSQEGIRFELSAKTSTGTVDKDHTFRSVVLTTHPGEADQTEQTLSDSAGQVVYSIPTSAPGWYRLAFSYGALNPGRTLSIQAYDADGNSLKMAWSDPPSANAQVRVRVAVDAPANVFLKGGAYRNTDPSQFANADNIRVNGNLLYRRSFDQGRYDFPLGQLSAGEQLVEFSLSASGFNPAKFWFGLNDTSFDPAGIKVSWDPVQFVYQGAMHTGDYDAWSEGVAFAQGQNIVAGVRPPPVRRGSTFAVAIEHSTLGSATSNAILRIYPYGSGSATNWPATLPTDGDYRGGIITAAGFSARNREHWRVNVPSNAPVGRYVLRAIAPNGAQIGPDVMFYVIHNPYPLMASRGLTKAELETFAYDEDEDGVELGANYGPDQDGLRDHFTAAYDGGVDSGYSPNVKITGSFRRTQDESYFSLLDLAVASAEGTTTEFESMRRLYRIVAQRIKYNRPDTQADSSITFATNNSLTPETVLRYSKPGTEFDRFASGQCFEYGTVLTALARSAGIVSRVISSDRSLGGWFNHVFMEAFIPNLPQHGGKVANSPTSANSDSDPWYVFDATDPAGVGSYERQWSIYSEAIGPRSQYGKASYLLSEPHSIPYGAVTTPLGWDPFATGSGPTLSVTAAYTSGPEFWLTTSGVTGWLGYGEKDVYRINKETTRAKAVRVRTLPNGGEYLMPKLCVGSVANTPVMPQRCANASTRYDLPSGDSYVIVFNDLNDQPAHRNLRGDSVQYVLELEY